MSGFSPNLPYNVPAQLFKPNGSKTVRGVTVKLYPEQGELIFCSFRTFGGTETTKNGVLSVENTAVVETWYRPDIQNNCRLEVGGLMYEIITPPENIEMRNQFLRFKIRALKGGA